MVWQRLSRWFLAPNRSPRLASNGFRPRIEGLEERLAPAVFTVTTANNAGAGSLRAAIISANSSAGADTITFAIGSGVQKINLLSALPQITETVTIDATTQPGYAAKPVVVLKGNRAGAGANGLSIAGVNANGCVVMGFAIRSFQGSGIVIESDNNTVAGCFIGTNPSGTAPAGNLQHGIVLKGDAANNTIGGNSSTTGNLISGNGLNGILLQGNGVTGNTLLGNYVGTNAAGTFTIPNGLDGIRISQGADTTTIGVTGAGNFIAGNGRHGVNIAGTGCSNNIVAGNSIAFNNAAGVRIAGGATNNTLGGASPTPGNVMAINGTFGVLITGAGTTGNKVQGNFIGTNSNGTAAAANMLDGVVIEKGASGNFIGGAGTGNLISGNNRFGISIKNDGTTGNLVSGNTIGLDSTGGGTMSNGAGGIRVVGGADGNTIGGTAAGASNVISGNKGVGVLVSATDSTKIIGNYIGSGPGGVGTFGNKSHGVFITKGSANTSVGDLTGAAGNLIANNQGAGVLIGTDPATKFITPAGTGNAVLGTVFFANVLQGIDLGPKDGVTANDPGDGDGGPNNRQNKPGVTSAVVQTGSTELLVNVSLASVAGTTFRIEIFASVTADASGFGEGQKYLGFVDITTDAAGLATGTITVPYQTSFGTKVTATATNLTTLDTSEFSEAKTTT